MYKIFEQLLQINNVTAYKVSKETGITQSTLSDWKRGRSTPKSENMKKIADYFGVTIDYLMTGKEVNDYDGSLLAEFAFLNMNMVKDFMELSENDKILVKNMINALARKSR